MWARILSRVQLLAISWTSQAPLPMEFSRQEYWSGVPFPTPEDLLDPAIEPAFLVSPALAGWFFTISDIVPYFCQLNPCTRKLSFCLCSLGA